MIRIDSNIAQRAKEMGLNISKVSENSLIKAIEAMEQVYGTKEPKIRPLSSLEKKDGGPSRIRTNDYRDVNAVS